MYLSQPRVLWSCTVVILILVQSSYSELTLTILHTNDVHSRFLQTNKYSGSCSQEEETKRQCYGGFARLHYKVQEIRATHKNVVYLSGGDYYQGTVWYTLYKWKIMSYFINKLNHTAMAFGNHEFDDNIGGIVPFLEAATFPVISCNIDDSKEPSIQGKYQKSVVVEVEGRKVGIIGFTTTETMSISNPGALKFNNVVTSIDTEAKRLNSQGVKILIAVGHAGFDVDMEIAKNVPLIDAVVGGHTNTFLYHGKAPDVEEPLGDYPTFVEQSGGRKVPVVQAYAYGKYLGYLNLTIDEEGEVVKAVGNPILMNYDVPQDPAMLAEIKSWGRNVSTLIKEEVGKTRVFLEGSAIECRLRECNLGNLVTDAMVHVNLKYPDDTYWSSVTMAIMNGGGIRSSIDEKATNESITMEELLTVLPFQNTIDLIEIRGEDLREAFEFSVDGYDPKGFHLPGKFLQVSGMRVTYDITKPNGSRVKELLVLCKACRVPKYVPLNDTEVYKIAVPTYIATGGDGYQILKTKAIQHYLSGILDSDVLVEYLKETSPIIQGLEGRITFTDEEDRARCYSSASRMSFNLIYLVIIVKLFYAFL